MTPTDFSAPPPTPPPPDVRVVASAPTQLSSLVCAVTEPRPGQPLPDELMDRAKDVFGDGAGLMYEFALLADAVGMFDADVPALLERLAEPVDFAVAPGLETEPEDERAVMWQRLQRLRGEPALRAEFVGLLSDLWDQWSGQWESTARDAAFRTADEWRRRLDNGADIFSLLPDAHIARREPFAQMTRDALRLGRTVHLSPTLAGLGHILAMPGGLSISASPVPDDPVLCRREAATMVAESLKTLAEPTRLTILTQIAAQPSSVGELAELLHIAQPTASVHLRKLRAAGLVDARREGSRTIYSARPTAVRTLLTRAEARLGGVMGPTR